MSDRQASTAFWIDQRRGVTFVVIGSRHPRLAFARMGAWEAVRHFLWADVVHSWYVVKDAARGTP